MKQPHEKYCPSCQDNLKIGFNPFTEPDKHRFCLHCNKHLPNGTHGRRKYCCNACKTAAYEKRHCMITAFRTEFLKEKSDLCDPVRTTQAERGD
jgi:hypothetical protein